MKRLASTFVLDLRLQKRYGFYYAAAFVTLIWVAVLRQLPDALMGVAVPFLVYEDLAVIGFYFVAGMVLFERGEATLQALVVTPLRFREYLASKVATLTLLAVVASLIIALASVGLGFNAGMLVLGTALMSVISILAGFIAVAPFRSVSDFLIPSQIFFLLANLPLIDYFGWWESWVFYIIPTQGSLLILRGAFEQIAGWQLAYGVVYQLVWIAGLGWLARRSFDRYIISRGGR